MHLQGKVTDKIHIYEAHEVHSKNIIDQQSVYGRVTIKT